MFGGCKGDYELLDDLYEFDLTDVVNSKIYNPEDTEEVKDMSVDRNCADVSMEREDEDTLVHVRCQQSMMNGLIIWNKNSNNPLPRSQLRVLSSPLRASKRLNRRDFP